MQRRAAFQIILRSHLIVRPVQHHKISPRVLLKKALSIRLKLRSYEICNAGYQARQQLTSACRRKLSAAAPVVYPLFPLRALLSGRPVWRDCVLVRILRYLGRRIIMDWR